MHPVLRTLLFGLALNGLDPRRQNCCFKIVMVLSFISVTSVFIVNLLQLVLNWHGVETIGEAFLISSTFIMAAKFSYLVIFKSDLVELLDTVAAFWKYDKFDAETERRVAKTLDRAMIATKIFAAAVILCGVSMIIPGFLNREIIFPGYDICDLKTDPCFPLHMGWHLFYTYFELFPVVLGFDGLFVSFIGYAYCDIEMIKVALKQFTLVVKKNHLPPDLRDETESERRKVNSDLADIVNEHAQVIEFIRKLNDFYSPMMLLHSGSSLFSLIFCLYMIALDGVPEIGIVLKYGTILGAVIFQFFIFCFSGTVILEQSKTMEYHFYDVAWWYKTQPHLRRALMLMIQRAQFTPKLKIGNMNDLNLESYLSVMRNGVSAFTLIKTMAVSDRLNAVTE